MMQEEGGEGRKEKIEEGRNRGRVTNGSVLLFLLESTLRVMVNVYHFSWSFCSLRNIHRKSFTSHLFVFRMICLLFFANLGQMCVFSSTKEGVRSQMRRKEGSEG
jgi:hypothetical protein